MNRLPIFLVMLLAFQTTVPAQDAALRERVNTLTVHVETLLEDKARQQKQISDLTREVESLRDQLRQSGSSAREEDVASLSQTVRELARKQEADKESILKAIEQLGRTTGSGSASRARSSNETGYEYTIARGDTLSTIVRAYNAEGIKVTVDDVIKANPGLKAEALQIGQKIFIPER